jgi:hypothetical protein
MILLVLGKKAGMKVGVICGAAGNIEHSIFIAEHST